jgi:hypothetical protein
MTTEITLPLSDETFDELSLLLGVDPTRFTDPELAAELQAEIDMMQETLMRETSHRDVELRHALQQDIEAALVSLASILQ